MEMSSGTIVSPPATSGKPSGKSTATPSASPMNRSPDSLAIVREKSFGLPISDHRRTAAPPAGRPGPGRRSANRGSRPSTDETVGAWTIVPRFSEAQPTANPATIAAQEIACPVFTRPPHLVREPSMQTMKSAGIAAATALVVGLASAGPG